jgi:flagellar FliL protein
MKKLLLIVILLLFLVGGGGAAWWFLLRQDEPATAGPQAPAPTEPAFVSLDPMAIPVIRADGTVRTFLVELALELPNPEAVEPVSQVLPVINDRLMVTLNELLGRKFIEESGYDQVLIKEHLLRVARKAAGSDRVSAVLIKNIEEFRRG